MFLLGAFHAAGIAGQAVLLVVIAGMPGATAGAHLASTALLVALVLMAWRRLPVSIDMPLAMLTVGGLGMTLGWWADLGFASATASPHAASSVLCSTPGASHAHGLLSWMNAGMLLFGLPAMRWLQRDPAAPHCGTRGCLLAAAWMVLGMEIGSRVAQLAPGLVPGGLAPAQTVLLDHAGMNVGMLLGMSLAALPAGVRRRMARPAAAAR